jgi:hypothetical protein
MAMPHRRWALIGVLALALCAALGMTMSSAAAAKKKGKKPKVARFFQQTTSPGAAIPDAPASGPSTPLRSTITVGKKFNGRVVGDVNVTGIQTTGSGDPAAGDLSFRIIAPNGQGVTLLVTSLDTMSAGPLTLDDDTFTEICYSNPPCEWAPQTLNAPFAGTANLLFNGSAGTGPLAALNGVGMRGTWTFVVWDENANGLTSILNSWGLQVTAKKPVT